MSIDPRMKTQKIELKFENASGWCTVCWSVTTQMGRQQGWLLFSTVAFSTVAFEIVPAFEFVDLTRLAGSRIAQPDLIAAATPRPEEQSASSLWRAWSTLRSSLWSSAVDEGGAVDVGT